MQYNHVLAPFTGLDMLKHVLGSIRSLASEQTQISLLRIRTPDSTGEPSYSELKAMKAMLHDYVNRVAFVTHRGTAFDSVMAFVQRQSTDVIVLPEPKDCSDCDSEWIQRMIDDTNHAICLIGDGQRPTRLIQTSERH
jgi:hypothetical protein